MTRRYTAEIMLVIGPDLDIPAPDMGTDEQTMAWIMDTYRHDPGPHGARRRHREAAFCVGGSAGRRDATGRGLVYVISPRRSREAGLELRGSRVAIQGFGNVGSVDRSAPRGVKGSLVTAVTDAKGGVFNPQRPRHPRAGAPRQGGRTPWPGSPTPSPITNADLLDAAVRRAGAGSPRGPDHREERGPRARQDHRGRRRTARRRPRPTRSSPPGSVALIPDILANAGGVIVSYFEWVQGLQYHFWTESEINSRLQEIMIRAFSQVNAMAKREHVDLRTAALMVGIRRVADAFQLRGFYP